MQILIGDNLSSHFSNDVLAACEKYDIAFICLPSNATHLMQPLDVAFYAPLKKYWRQILTDWKKNEGRKLSTLSKDVFPQLLKKLHNRLTEDGKGSQNLISGFRKAGLYPFDPMQPKRRLPPEQIATDETPTLVSNAVVEMLTAMRTGSDTSLPKQRRKRVTVEPGRSITANDIVASTSTAAPKCTRFKKKNPRKLSSSEDEEVTFEAQDSSENTSDKSDSDDLPLAIIEKNTEKKTEELKDFSRTPVVNDWVVVEYQRKNNHYHFIGKIVSMSEDPENLFKVDFLKKSTKTNAFFVPTEKDDDDFVTHEMIVKILQNPVKDGTGKRPFFKFSHDDLSRYNLTNN